MKSDGECWARDLGLLLLRVCVGSFMLVGHGWGKLMRFFGEGPIQFADPLGMGVTTSLVLAVLGEVVCSALIVIGLGTRLACIPFAITMGVAGFVVHAADPWQKKELAFMYLVPAVALALTGPGRLSVDHWIMTRWRAGKPVPANPDDPGSTVVKAGGRLAG